MYSDVYVLYVFTRHLVDFWDTLPGMLSFRARMRRCLRRVGHDLRLEFTDVCSPRINPRIIGTVMD